jgi:hypothetical protein
MESTLATYAEAFRRATAEAERLVQPLTPEQFNWKPSATSWSVAECLVHLNRAHAPYLPAFEGRLERGGPPGFGPFRYGPVARWFIGAIGPESPRKTKTLAAMDPNAGGSQFEPDRVLADFRVLNQQMVAVIERAEGLDVARMRMASPFFRLLRLPVGALWEALAGHAVRHLGQARRVAEHPGFPR